MDGEVRHRRAAIPSRHFPVLCDVAQGEIDQLHGRLVVRKIAASFDELGHLHMLALDHACGVDDAAALRREREKRHDLFPVPPAGTDDRRILFAERLSAKTTSSAAADSALGAR